MLIGLEEVGIHLDTIGSLRNRDGNGRIIKLRNRCHFIRRGEAHIIPDIAIVSSNLGRNGNNNIGVELLRANHAHHGTSLLPAFADFGVCFLAIKANLDSSGKRLKALDGNGYVIFSPRSGSVLIIVALPGAKNKCCGVINLRAAFETEVGIFSAATNVDAAHLNALRIAISVNGNFNILTSVNRNYIIVL